MDNRFIKSYLRERMKPVGLLAGAVLILFLIAGIYGYEESFQNMSYALFLILFFGGWLALWDYGHYYRKCRKLKEAPEHMGVRIGDLPEAESMPEQLYQDLISVEEQEKQRLTTEYDEKRKDMADYYTMWIHQIKTPIAAMRLLMEDEKELSAVRELFKIEQYAEMALNYARLDSLSSDLLFQKQEVYPIVKQAVKKYGVLFAGSKLSFSLEEFSCSAVTDEKWLCFVIEQLLSNALKYTGEGGISIYGADEEGAKRTGSVEYLVLEDTGIGIRREDLPRIFERGFTGYNGRVDKRSTGIGLYLCRQIMDRLSHKIRVESEEGLGTRVILGFAQEHYRDM